MKNKLVSVLAVTVCIGASAATFAEPSERISVTFTGAETVQRSFQPVISGNGRYVAFTSDDPNIVQNDTNNDSDVFVRDLLTGIYTRVSVDNSGQETLGDSYAPSISYDGRIVVFESQTDPLTGGATAGSHVFVRDLSRAETYLVSADGAGTPANNWSGDAQVSSDGRFVVFDSVADNLTPDDISPPIHSSSPGRDWFRKDLDADGNGILSSVGPVEVVNRDSWGVQHSDPGFDNAYISEGGHFVTFTSNLSDFVQNDTNQTRDVFLRDMDQGATSRVDLGRNGAEADHESIGGGISRDGRYVVFTSWATNLTSQPLASPAFYWRVYRRDRLRGITELVSVDPPSGTPGEDPALSPNGEIVVYSSTGDGWVPGDVMGGFGRRNVYLRVMSQVVPQPLRRISTHWPVGSTDEADDHSPVFGPASVSRDGTVAFTSMAAHLTSNADTNGVSDVYIQRVPLPNLKPQLELSRTSAGLVATTTIENASAYASDPAHSHLVVWEAIGDYPWGGPRCITDPNSPVVLPNDKFVTELGEVADVRTLHRSAGGPLGSYLVGSRVIVGIIRNSPLRYTTSSAAIPGLAAHGIIAGASLTHTIVDPQQDFFLGRFIADDQHQLAETVQADNVLVKCVVAAQPPTPPIVPAVP